MPRSPTFSCVTSNTWPGRILAFPFLGPSIRGSLRAHVCRSFTGAYTHKVPICFDD